jgi:O-antigen ligase
MVQVPGEFNILFLIPIMLIIVLVIIKSPLSLLSIYLAQPWILNIICFKIPSLPFIYLSYIIVMLTLLFGKYNIRILNTRIFVLLAVFTFYIITHTIFSPISEQTIGIDRSFIFLNFLPGLLIVSTIRSLDDLKIFIISTIKWLLFFQVLFVCAVMFWNHGVGLRETEVMGLTIQYSNSALLIVMAFILWDSMRALRGKLLIVSSMVLASIVLLLSQSRSFLLGIFIFIILYVVRRPKYIFYSTFIIILIIITLGIFYYLDINTNLIKNINEDMELKILQHTSANLNTLSANRLEIWSSALDEFIEHPVFGVGLGNSLNDYSGFEALYVHNFYLEILSGLGIFGGILIITILGMAFMYLFKLRKHEDALLDCFKYSLLIYLIAAIFKADWGPIFIITLLIERLYFLKFRQGRYKENLPHNLRL